MVCESCKKDLAEYSFAHNNMDPDETKEAAFLFYYMSKFKPILAIDDDRIDTAYLSINEYCGFAIGAAHVGKDIDEIDDKYLLNIAISYYLRSFDAKSQFHTFELLQKTTFKQS
jgi:hypothetical protein